MAKVHTAVKQSLFGKWALALLAFAQLLLPSTALAMPYGSGSYDACKYEDGCPVATTGTSTEEDEAGSTVTLNTFEDFFSATGTDVAGLVVGDVVEFCIGKTTIFQACDSTKGSFHTVTLKSINLEAKTVVITIASTPTDYTLTLDTPQKIDIDKDETDDVEVTLTDMTATTADINFRSLETSTPSVAETTNTDDSEDTTESPKSSNRSWLWWLLGVVGLLGLIATVIVFVKKSHDGGDDGAGYGSGPMGSGSGSSGSGANPNGTTTSNFSGQTTFTPESYAPASPQVSAPQQISTYNTASTSSAPTAPINSFRLD